MGRFRRKKHYYKQDENKGGKSEKSSVNNSHQDGFNPREKKRIVRYLEEYRDGADRAAIKQGPSKAVTSNVKIAGIDLPNLTEEVISAPYLKLPAEFSFKQRQFIHDTCVELGIYHCGIGRYKSEERCVAISIYCDIFEHIDGFCRPDYLYLNRSVSPWFCRHEIANSREELTESFRQKVQEYIDQPWQCLREGVDVLNFAELEGQDLSTVPLPGFEGDETGDTPVDTNWMLVDTPDKMKQCIKELQEGDITELAFDLEAYNYSKYSQLTCLLQLSSNLGKEYVIDPLAKGVWDEICGLAPIFADPKIVKIGHSIGGLDVRCLHRDFGIYIRNVFDTYEASKVLNLQSHGLTAVCKHYGLPHSEDYTDLKDVYQTTDWRQRPLSKQMILYGRYDVHFLIKLRELMMRDLTHHEIFSNNDEAESKLVAESLAATLQRIQAYEDGDGDEFEQFGNGSAYLSVPEEEGEMEIEQRNGFDKDDFGDNNDNTEESFYTPKHANSFDDFEESEATIESGDEQAKESGASSGILELYNDNDNVDGITDVRETKIASAEALRMQPRLMRVLSWSQERCKDLWSGRSEPYYRNPVFVALMQRGKQQQNKKQKGRPLEPLSQSQIHLYEDLVRLRAYIAKRDECLPGFVCSLNDLALVASERPTNVDALRLINFFLPEILGVESNDSFVKQIFVLTQKSLSTDGVLESRADAAVRKLYDKPGGESYGRKTLRRVTQMALATAICGGVLYTAMTFLKRRRK